MIKYGRNNGSRTNESSDIPGHLRERRKPAESCGGRETPGHSNLGQMVICPVNIRTFVQIH